MGAAIDRLARGLELSGRLVLVFMVATVCYDAVMRYAFLAPTSWSLEVNTFLIVYLALIPAADVLRTDDHLRITFLIDRLGGGARRALAAVTGLLGVGFCAVLVWRGAVMSLQAYEYGERMSTPLGTPMALPYLLIPIGFGVLALRFAVNLVAALRGPATT